MKHVMIIDDDRDLTMLLCDMLEDNGYEVSDAGSIDEAYEMLTQKMPHLIVLDINLPDGTGFEVCQELRQRTQVPIIFASARTSEDDKVNGLDMGGDDYIAKPYSLKEMMSRINSLMRRAYGNETTQENVCLKISDSLKIEIDRQARLVKKNGVLVELSPKEYELFVYMVQKRGCALSKEQLINEVWGAYSEVEPSTLTVHIRWLREKFEIQPSKPTLIKTVWGVGYLLEA